MPSGSEDGPAPNFDRVARPYRWMEYCTFGPLLESCRFAQLSSLGQPRRALLFGDGDGRFLARLLDIYPDLTVDFVDSSPAMIQLARARVRSHRSDQRVNFHIADARQFPIPPGNYDLVSFHFFLDCLTIDEIRNLLLRLNPHLNKNSLCVVSEFAIPARNPMRALAKGLIRSLYLAFRLLANLRVQTLPDHRTCLLRAGFTSVREKTLLLGILRSELWQRGDG